MKVTHEEQVIVSTAAGTRLGYPAAMIAAVVASSCVAGCSHGPQLRGPSDPHVIRAERLIGRGRQILNDALEFCEIDDALARMTPPERRAFDSLRGGYAAAEADVRAAIRRCRAGEDVDLHAEMATYAELVNGVVEYLPGAHRPLLVPVVRCEGR